MKQDNGLYLFYFLGVMAAFYLIFLLLELETHDIGLMFAILTISAHFIASKLSDPNGIWTAPRNEDYQNKNQNLL